MTKVAMWYAVRLVIAAILLWFDVRLFGFYAFVMILGLIHRIGQLEVLTAARYVQHESKLMALCAHEEVSSVEIQSALNILSDGPRIVVQ